MRSGATTRWPAVTRSGDHEAVQIRPRWFPVQQDDDLSVARSLVQIGHAQGLATGRIRRRRRSAARNRSRAVPRSVRRVFVVVPSSLPGHALAGGRLPSRQRCRGRPAGCPRARFALRRRSRRRSASRPANRGRDRCPSRSSRRSASRRAGAANRRLGRQWSSVTSASRRPRRNRAPSTDAPSGTSSVDSSTWCSMKML